MHRVQAHTSPSGVRGPGARAEKVENDLQWKAGKTPGRVCRVIIWSAIELEEWEVGRDPGGTKWVVLVTGR